MRKYLFVALVVALSAGTVVAYASGGHEITRNGADANGYANPGGCEVFAEGTDMHVNCSHGTRAARIRYRALKDHGFVRGPATVSADIHQIKGRPCVLRWMDQLPFVPARTARVYVPPGSYCHIRSVTASQP